MKKIFWMTALLSVLITTAFAQTSRTSRTNSRPHNAADTAGMNNRMNAPTDADRNNPNNNTNTNNGINTTNPNGTLSPNGATNPATNNPNNPNINNNVR